MNRSTKALALKLGPYINVNAICPSWIRTEMVADNDPELETALKRFRTPDEVANAALYLASDESDFVTGELHIVAGGRGRHSEKVLHRQWSVYFRINRGKSADNSAS